MLRPTFLARCAECGQAFSRPEVSDFAYGSALFSTSDGQRHLLINGLDTFPQRVNRFVSDDNFWETLARLADPIDGQALVAKRPCPHCGSTDLQDWCGRETGNVDVEEVTFERARSLDDAALASRIEAQLTWEPNDSNQGDLDA